VLDLLEYVKGNFDGTLSFRARALTASAAPTPCASTAVTGWHARCCAGAAHEQDHRRAILGLPIIKDLIVDMEPFFANFRSVMPYFVNDEPPRSRSGCRARRTGALRRHTKCILCACCTLLPSFWSNDEYLGRRRSWQRTVSFSTAGTAPRRALEIMNEQFGVYRCHTIFNCTTPARARSR